MEEHVPLGEHEHRMRSKLEEFALILKDTGPEDKEGIRRAARQHISNYVSQFTNAENYTGLKRIGAALLRQYGFRTTPEQDN